MGKIIYESSFKNHLQSHVDLKQAIGYKYETDAGHLKRFDRFLVENYPLATSLTKEMVLKWCSKKSYESQANQCARASILRQFGRYLVSMGIEAYILPKGYFPSEKQYVPYIYTRMNYPDSLPKPINAAIAVNFPIDTSLCLCFFGCFIAVGYGCPKQGCLKWDMSILKTACLTSIIPRGIRVD